MGRRPQHGGAKNSLLGSGYVEDITNADEMMEKVSFNLLVCHGTTDVKNLMTVPEDTFLIYTTLSGFYAYIDVKRHITWKGTMNLDKLLSPEYHEGANAAVKEGAFKEALFRNFFRGDYDLFRMYKGMQIFCPGDIVQGSICSFSHSMKQLMWHKGLYEVPMTKERASRFILEYPSKSRQSPLYIILTQKADRPEYAEAYADAKPVEEHKEMLEALAGLTDETEYNKYFAEALKAKGLPNTFKELIPKLFENPWAFGYVLAKTGYFNDDNKLISQGICGDPRETVSLSDVLYKMRTPAGKKYKIIIYSACRNPIGLKGMDAPNVGAVFPTHRTLPKDAEPQRTLARRLSLAPKEREETCAMGPAPEFNLGNIKDILNIKKGRNGLLSALSSYSLVVSKELKKKYHGFDDPLYRLAVVGNLFDWADDRLTMAKFSGKISISMIAYILDGIVSPSLFLAMPEDAKDYKRYEKNIKYGKELLAVYKETFGRFMYDLRKDAPDLAPELKSLGELLMKETGNAAYNAGLPAETRKAAAAAEEAWFGETMRKERAAEAAVLLDTEYQRRRQEILNLEGYFTVLRIRVKSILTKIREALKKLQTNTKGAATLPEQLEIERGFLETMKADSDSGIPGVTMLDILEERKPYKDLLTKVIELRAEFDTIPEANGKLDVILRQLEKVMALKKEYQQVRSAFERRVGEMEIQKKEDEDREAAAAASKPQGRRSGFRGSSTRTARRQGRAAVGGGRRTRRRQRK